MTLWAIVPVKPLRRGKSRLSDVLSPDERADLNRRLVVHTLETLTAIPEIEHVLVISRDQGALALARDHGARTVQENGAPKLNVALARATLVAKNYATRGILIVPADLPLITPEDVRAILDLIKEPPVVIVSPDRHRQGLASGQADEVALAGVAGIGEQYGLAGIEQGGVDQAEGTGSAGRDQETLRGDGQAVFAAVPEGQGLLQLRGAG